MHADGADLADSGATRAQAGRLEVDDDVGGALERGAGTGRIGEADRAAAPREPGVALDDVREQAAREPDRRVAQREEGPCRVLRRHRAASGLDELDETVGGVERELHAPEHMRTRVRLPGQKEDRPVEAALESFRWQGLSRP